MSVRRSARASHVWRTRRVVKASGLVLLLPQIAVMPSSSSLDRTLLHGIAWTSLIRWGTQLASWVITLFVAHILAPSDYGLVGMALIYFGFAQLVCDAGLTGAIVQTRGLQEPQLAAIGTVAGIVGVVLGALTFFTAPYVAVFFREARVTGILTVLSVTFPIRGLQILPRGLLAKELRFRTLAFIDGLESGAVMTTTLVMALAGAGYWSLVGGPIVGTLTSTTLCFCWRPHRLALPRDYQSLRPALRIGWHLLVSNIAWYAYSNADFTVVGRVLGTAALGAYTLAWTIASVPVDRISSLVGRVTPAFFAAVQTDPPTLRRYLSLLTEGLAFVTLPLCLGLFLTAHDFVQTFLGVRWSGVTLPLQLLALYAALRSVAVLAPQVLVSTGRSGRSMIFSVLALLILPPVFYVGTRWGTAGVALGWVTVYPVLVVTSFVRYALRAIDMRWRTYLATLFPASIAAAAMTAAVWAARDLVPLTRGARLQLGAEVSAGACAYLLTAWLLRGRRILALFAFFRGLGAPARGEARRTRMVVVSYHFPPDPAVGAQRWGKLVRYAVERGWQVEVVTRDPGQLERRDPSGATGIPADVRVHAVPHRPRRAGGMERGLRALYRALKSAVRGNGRKTAGATVAAASPRFVPSDSLGREEMARWPRSLRAWVRMHHAWMELSDGERWARDAEAVVAGIIADRGASLIVTCGPPHTIHRAGEVVHERTGIPWVVDLRDPWSLVQRLPEEFASPLWLAVASRGEARALRSAALVVANTPGHANALRALYPSAEHRIIAVPNGCDDEPLPRTRRDHKFVLAYTGTIYLDRDPSPLFRAIAQVVRELGLTPDDLGLELMGNVTIFRDRWVPDLAAEAGVAEFVRVRPPGSRREAQELQAQATMLVLLPQDSDLAIPAKTFEYLRFEAWLLALTTGGSATAELLSGSPADVVSPDDVGEIARVIRRRYEAFRSGARPGAIGLDPRYSRRTQAEVLFSAVEQAIGVVDGASAEREGERQVVDTPSPASVVAVSP